MALSKYDIYCGVHYRDNTLYDMYSSTDVNCPESQKFSNKTISLPLHLFLSEKDVLFICNSIKEVLRSKH